MIKLGGLSFIKLSEWKKFVFRESVTIKVNDDIVRYFQMEKWLRQDNPLSSMVFTILADMLAITIERSL
jgi:hypothetical protein